MKQTLQTADVGVIYLRIEVEGGQKWYVCSSLSLSMHLNTLPVASVVVGGGVSLRMGHLDKADNNAEDILRYVMDAKHNNADDFIKCDIVEVIKNDYEDTTIVIFKGCIISASLVYKTGATTIRAVRVECMNEACKLYAQPLSAYNHTVGSYIVGALTYELGKNKTPDQKTSVSTYGMTNVGSLTTADVCKETIDLCKHQDIATKIAYIADAITLLSTKVVDTVKPEEILKKLQDGILGIKKYIKSDYKINYGDLTVNDEETAELTEDVAINSVTDAEFDHSLCDMLLSSMKTTTVYDAILRALISTEFMLTLVPKWNSDNHMMSIEPSHAWESKPSVTITFDEIAEFNSAYRPFDHINDPEVFAVNFSPAVNFEGTQGQEGNPSSLIGAFSTNKDVATWLKERYNSGEQEDPLRDKLTGATTHFKWFIYPSPNWLRTAFIMIPKKSSDPKANDAQADIKNQRTQIKEGTENEKQKETSENAVEYDYQKAHRIADKIAQALYVHMHGESASAQLILLPSARFGLDANIGAIESNIGKLIDIVPSRKEDKYLAMRGMIEGIEFSYSAGMSASCQYALLLSRVRPLNQSTDDITCPLYVSENDSAIPEHVRTDLDELVSVTTPEDVAKKLAKYTALTKAVVSDLATWVRNK